LSDLRRQLQDAFGDKYRVVRELTGGGMARVFLSEDTKLEREVVVKVLSPDLMDEQRLDRFRQEVLQTARLQHPTIVAVLDVGTIEASGRPVPYYVMPYVRGESLRSRLRHEPRLSVGLTIRILRGVLDALAHAHALGVIHRDIKPENIFLSGTNAVLADFGIAKALAGPGSADAITGDGMTVGTPTYMAPEQLVGSDAIDHRADLFSVGVVAYEMLVGELPWGGSARTPVEKLAIQARNRLVPIRTSRPDVPPEMAAIIEACLSWEAVKRPQSAEDALRVIESLPITPTTSNYRVPETAIARALLPKRIAIALAVIAVLGIAAVFVQPFRGRAAAEKRLAVLYPEVPASSGIVAEQLFHSLVTTLSPISNLRLMGQVSVSTMVEQGFSTRQIADSLRLQGIDSALLIRARPATGGGFQLSLALLRLGAVREETLAGPISIASLDGLPLDSVRSIMGRLLGPAVAKLRLTSATHTVPEPQVIDAWLAWQRGRDAYASRSPEGMALAIHQFERAISLDSMYAQAYAELAQTLALSLFYKYRVDAPYETAVRSMRLASRAIALQPSLADGYLARGYLGTVLGAPVTFLERNYAEAQRLLSTNPYSQVWYNSLLSAKGEHEEAFSRVQREVERDPRSAAPRVSAALYGLASRRYLAAARDAAAARSLGSNIPLTGQLELMGKLLLGGRAVDDCANVASGPYLGMRALCLERTDKRVAAQSAADSLFAIITGKAPMDSTFDLSLYVVEMATYYAARRERDSARQWLRQGVLESPGALDSRLLRAGFFDPETIQFADSLRAEAWGRVNQLVIQADREGRPVR
jgi:tetratricopeptide (TPR) repeat protein